jgi:hypothetical protein
VRFRTLRRETTFVLQQRLLYFESRNGFLIRSVALWCNWLTRRPLKAKSSGSSPDNATKINNLRPPKRWSLSLVDTFWIRCAGFSSCVQPPHQIWGINTAAPFVKTTSDFGLVARFHDPATDQILVVAAGIGENGTPGRKPGSHRRQNPCRGAAKPHLSAARPEL